MIRSKKQSLIIVGAFVIALMLFTTTYAFFNYTRTGTANTIKTGRIAFNAEQGPQVTLSDLFPITLGDNEEVTASTPGVGSLSLHVTGDTTYTEGIEYLVKAVNVTSSGVSLPISINISYEAAEGQGKTIGTSSNDYYTVRGGNTSYYKVISEDTITDDGDLVVGYIAPGQTGIDGYITIMAYLDARNIAISDTYPEGTVRVVKTTGYSSSACETALTGVQNASTYCATASSLQDAIDDGDLTSAQVTLLVNAGIVDEYTDGTTSEWVGTRTVFTTEQWNALRTNGISFQVKVEANEGIWVTNPGSATLSISPVSGSVSVGNSMESTITTNGNGTLSCASSDDTKATCSISNNTLTVTGVAAGNATITVTEAAGTLFATPATETFEVEVIGII